jgi:uncharacterized paraquat-inducible protein A
LQARATMLISCPDCQTLVSDKAASCPKCGRTINRSSTDKLAGLIFGILKGYGLALLAIIVVASICGIISSPKFREPSMIFGLLIWVAIIGGGIYYVKNKKR